MAETTNPASGGIHGGFCGERLLRARVPWPREAGNAPVSPALDDLRRVADGGMPAARFAFRFCALPAPEADVLLREALRAARSVWIADFVLAERNLHLAPCLALRLLPGLNPLLAFGPWREPARRIGEFFAAGALFGLLQRAGVHIRRERPLLAAAASLVEIAT